MPAPIIGRKLGTGKIPPLEKEKAKGIKVLGVSGSSRQQPEMSKSERLLVYALDLAKNIGAETEFMRLKDLKIYDCEGNYSENPNLCTYPCQSSIKYEDDQMQRVYDAILSTDVLILATPIRWNNHSALVQKFVERMNCIENSDIFFGKKLITNKVAGLIVIGHVDGLQHVAGNLLNFFSWLGFNFPDVAITSWVGEYDEDTTKDWEQIQKNEYTQEDLKNMVNSSINLAYHLKEEQERVPNHT
jgi:multimeric flavodoxin WrbA